VTDQLARKANALEQANARLAALTDLNLQLASELDRTYCSSVCVAVRVT